MPKFKKEKKVLRAQAGILTPFSGKSRTSAPASNVDVYPVVPQVYVDPMQREGTYGGGGIDEAYKWLIGKSEGLPFGIKSLADINRGLLPGVADQSDVNRGLAEIAEMWRSGKSPSDIGVMRGSSSIGEPAKDTAKPKQEEAAPSKKEAAASKAGLNQAPRQSGQARAKASPSPGVVNQELIDRLVKSARMKTTAIPEATKFTPTMSEVDQDAMMNAITSAYMGPKKSDISDLTSRLTGASSAAAAIPKTKAGLKKFMQEYGKFIALGAMAGQGGRGGQIAAPIMAALPGLIEMMKSKKKGETMKKAGGGKIMEALEGMYGAAGDTDTLEYLKKGPIPTGRESKAAMTKGIKKLLSERLPSSPASAIEYRPQRGADNEQVGGYWSMPFNWREKLKGVSTGSQDSGKKKSSGGEPPKKSEGGAIRKFKGGSMKGNSMDSMLTPKYAKGGKTDKMDKMGKMGKAAGEMPQHKKMAMGKPTPQSTGQKFAKGGAAKYAGGGMCKGYGISKKIRPTGPMN